MKYTILFSLCFAISLNSYSQSSYSETIQKLNGNIRSDISYSNLKGSPFLFNKFMKSEVYFNSSDEPVTYKLNYNAYKDQIEFLENDEVYRVTNTDELEKVIINKHTFVYKRFYNYDEINEGYFIEIINDYVSLYKKELKKVVTSNAVAYKSDESVTGSFNKTSPLYYVSIYGDPLIYIQSKRKFLNLFFNNQSLIEFMDRENIKLSSEKDLKKVITFLNDVDKNRR